MSIATAEMIWIGAAAYFAAGALFALFFSFAGAARIDRTTKGASPFFRLLLLPGAALLWPLLLLMWIAGAGADRRNAS
jgi:hypothetical protein